MNFEILRWQGSGSPREPELRSSLEAEGYEVFSWSDSPAATYDAHSHPHDESIWLFRGEMTFGIDGESHVLVTGDRLMLPKGTVHTAIAGGDGASYLVGQRD